MPVSREFENTSGHVIFAGFSMMKHEQETPVDQNVSSLKRVGELFRLHHHALCTATLRQPNLHFSNKMKYSSRFYLLFASLVPLTQAQGSNDGCITCYLGDLFKDGFEYGLGDLVLPAAARFFTSDLPSNPGVIDPAQGFVEPQTDPEEDRSTNNLPGDTGQTDFELHVIGEPDPKCDPNSAGVSSLLPSHRLMQNAGKI